MRVAADPYTLFLGELTLMGFAETRRLMDYRKPGSQSKQFFLGLEAAFGGSGNPAYPGGQWFNMTGMGTKDEAEMKKLKANEVKNGRLAMIAMLGYFVQAAVTHQGPYENLCAHLSNPTGANFMTSFGAVRCPAFVWCRCAALACAHALMLALFLRRSAVSCRAGSCSAQQQQQGRETRGA